MGRFNCGMLGPYRADDILMLGTVGLRLRLFVFSPFRGGAVSALAEGLFPCPHRGWTSNSRRPSHVPSLHITIFTVPVRSIVISLAPSGIGDVVTFSHGHRT